MTEAAATPGGSEAQEKPRASAWRRLGRSFRRNTGAMVGLLLVGALVLTALFAPWIASYGERDMGVGPLLGPPSAQHWFGTDEFGRDIFSRVVYGTRLTLQVGVIAVGIALSCGLVLGVLGGYAGGWLERILMRLVDVLFSFTETLIALAAVAILGPSLTNAMIAVGIASIPFYARVAYGVVLVEKNTPYFEAAYAAGAGHARMILLHLLPNVIPPLVVVATLGISMAVLAAAGLSFLGLGAQPPSPEWGAMLSAGRDYFTRAPWIMTFPGIAIALTVLGFNLFGDGIREVLDPRQRR